MAEPFFTKVDTGIYRFTIGAATDARTHIAYRNEAGFAGRAWSLWTVGPDGLSDECIVDDLATRDECVHQAYLRLVRSREFAAALARAGKTV